MQTLKSSSVSEDSYKRHSELIQQIYHLCYNVKKKVQYQVCTQLEWQPWYVGQMAKLCGILSDEGSSQLSHVRASTCAWAS